MSSWLSGFAGKAETFLNKMDQTAAAALSGSDPSNRNTTDNNDDSPTAVIPHLVTYQPRYTPTPLPAPATVIGGHSRNSSIGSSFSTVSSRDVYSSNGGHTNATSIPLHLQNHSLSPPSIARGVTKSAPVDDDKLLEYLNSPAPASSSASKGKERSNRSGIKRTPSSRKISSEEQSIASIEVVSVGSSDDGRHSKQDDLDDEEISSSAAERELNIKSCRDESPLVSSGHTDDGTIQGDTQSLASLVTTDQAPHIENLNECDDVDHLKETISSLGKEISTLNRRNIECETELKRMNKRLENWQNQLSSSGSALRELQMRELDLKSAIEARDSAISVLKVRLQESDDQLKAKSECIEGLRLEYDLLVKEKQESSSNLNQDIESLSKRLRQLESELCQEKENSRLLQLESLNQMGTLEENNRTLLDELSTLQRDLKSEKSKRKEIERQLSSVKSSHEAIFNEFQEYKVKANNILQSKDNLIRALQRRSNEGDEGIADTNDFQIDFEESNKQTLILQSQCDTLVQEVQELRAKNESLKEELKRVKEEEVHELVYKVSTLNEEFDELRRHKDDLEEEHRLLQDEMRQIKEDYDRTKTSLQVRISERDKEVDRLRKQLVAKRSASSNENSVQELEIRIQSLTSSLLQKQTLIEQLSSEKQSLGLQLERSEARFRNAMDEMSLSNTRSAGSGSVAIGMVNSMSASTLVNRNGYRSLLENPYDGEVTKRVKRVYSQFDSLSIRMGQFLRVYPAARGFILLYILVLHIWVFLILFYNEPPNQDTIN